MLGVDLGRAGVPECDHVITGETKEEVLASVREHLQTEHDRSVDDTLLESITLLIGPIKK